VATLSLVATVEFLVTDVQYTVLIRFTIIAQCSKGTHYFHRVVGLVVNICQWIRHSYIPSHPPMASVLHFGYVIKYLSIQFFCVCALFHF